MAPTVTYRRAYLSPADIAMHQAASPETAKTHVVHIEYWDMESKRYKPLMTVTPEGEGQSAIPILEEVIIKTTTSEDGHLQEEYFRVPELEDGLDESGGEQQAIALFEALKDRDDDKYKSICKSLVNKIRDAYNQLLTYLTR